MNDKVINDKAIEFINVTFGYNKNHPILNDVSFYINKGEYCVLLGHNGSGKSTLSKLAIGLITDKSGDILINGRKLCDETITKIRQNVGIVFQNPDNQFVGSTVKDDIAFGMENRCIDVKEMEEKVLKYATLVGMNEYLDRNPESLSGGQKQRVAIASVLAFEPDILILDEATSMLDPTSVREVNNTIKSLIGKKTILAITHNLNEACYADRVIVLDGGKIVLNDTPANVFKEKEILKKANLDITIPMKLLELIETGNINEKENLKEILWELTFQK